MSSRIQFIIILIGSFISQVGSHLLTLAISSFVMLQTGSAVMAGLVFVAAYLPSVLLAPWLGGLIDRHVGRKVLIVSEFLAIGTTLIAGYFAYHEYSIGLLCAVLSVRSVLAFNSRTVLLKFIKLISTPAEQTDRIKLFFLTFFVSTAVAGVMAALFLQSLNIIQIAFLDCLTFLTAIGFFVLLKDPKVVPSSDAEFEYNFLSTLGEMLSVRATRTALFLIVFSQAVFQGAYSALVTYAPIKQYGLGLSGVGFYQLAASLGIISGFLVVWFAPRLFSRHNSDLLWLTVFIAILGCAFVFLTVSANSILLSLFSFYIFNALFECIWLHYSAEFFRASPTGRLGRYQFVCTSLAALTMSLMTLLYTTAIHLWGGAIGVAIVMGTALILIIVIGFFSNFLPAAKEV